VGFEVGHRYLAFQTFASHTNYSYAKLRFEQKFRKRYTLSLGAGPSFSSFAGRDWDPSYAVDGRLTRQSRRTTIGLSFGHETRLSNFQGAFGSTSATASIGFRTWHRFSPTATFGFARSRLINGTGDLDAFSGSQRFGYDISPSWQAYVGYSYATQLGVAAVPNQHHHKNLFSFGITYTLSPAVRY
jgi:hypothetical protein